jgi:ATP-dependent Zn protease
VEARGGPDFDLLSAARLPMDGRGQRGPRSLSSDHHRGARLSGGADGPRRQRQRRIAYGDLVAKAETSPRSISSVLFVPNHHEIRVTLADGSTVKSNYPTEASQLEFQHVLQDANIPFDSRGTGGSAWWSILTYLLSFALFFAFWIFLKRQVDARRARRDEPSTREDPFEN